MSTMKEHIIILIFLQKGIDNQLCLYNALLYLDPSHGVTNHPKHESHPLN